MCVLSGTAMKDMRAVRFNEKVRRATTLAGNGGLALLAAGLSRWFVTRLDLYAALWIFTAIALMFLAVQFNELLEPEEHDDPQ